MSERWATTQEVMKVLSVKGRETIRRMREAGAVFWKRLPGGRGVRIKVDSEGFPVDPPQGWQPPPMAAEE